MIQAMIWCVVIAVAQPSEGATENRGPKTWTEFYRDTAGQYTVTYAGDGAAPRMVPLVEHAVFDWASLGDFNGGVFAWTENGRPAVLASMFSSPRPGSKERMLDGEFASFAATRVTVDGPGGIQWSPPPLVQLERVPDASLAPADAKRLKLQCRRLAKEFSASMNRRVQRWDLRLLTTPLLEYPASSAGVLGGGLFAFVGYSTDPEILLLLEAREGTGGPAWHFHPVRFSDKSLYLSFKGKPVWQSLRGGHGSDGPDTDDPLYRVLSSQRFPPEVVEQLSAKPEGGESKGK